MKLGTGYLGTEREVLASTDAVSGRPGDAVLCVGGAVYVHNEAKLSLFSVVDSETLKVVSAFAFHAATASATLTLSQASLLPCFLTPGPRW